MDELPDELTPEARTLSRGDVADEFQQPAVVDEVELSEIRSTKMLFLGLVDLQSQSELDDDEVTRESGRDTVTRDAPLPILKGILEGQPDRDVDFQVDLTKCELPEIGPPKMLSSDSSIPRHDLQNGDFDKPAPREGRGTELEDV